MKALEVYQVSQVLRAKILEMRKCTVMSPIFCTALSLQRTRHKIVHTVQFHLHETLEKTQPINSGRKENGDCPSWGRDWQWEGTPRNLLSFEMFYVFIILLVTWVYTFVKSHQTVHLNIYFIVCKLYLNIVDELKPANYMLVIRDHLFKSIKRHTLMKIKLALVC